MFVLHENARPKKRPRDCLETTTGDLAEQTEQGRKRKRTARGDSHTGHWPAGFWNRLSKVHLTRGALREFERRTAQDGSGEPQRPPVTNTFLVTSTESGPRRLQRFSRHGGPDLTHIRGFAVSHDRKSSMSQSSSNRKRSSASGVSGSGRTNSTGTSKGSYDPNFKQNMIDGGIFPHDRKSKPANIDAIRDHLQIYRASLSPSRFDDAKFEDFMELNERALGETQAMANVFTIIEGEGRHKYYSGGPNHPFNRLEPLAEQLPRPQPDTYDGARPEQVDRRVRQDLGRHIVPCNDSSRPAAPNFFIEGKSASARLDVAKLQACHDGAVGARVMHSLENYRRHKQEYDGNVKSYSSTYHPATSTLQLFGHHMTAPQAPRGLPEYHMTQIRSFAMTDNAERFREGATAFRNLRDLAESTRDSAVQVTNRAARHAPASNPSTTFTRSRDSRSVTYECESDTSTDELAAQELTTKRQRHSAGQTTKMNARQVAPKTTTPSRHSITGNVDAPKRQVQPSQKVIDRFVGGAP